MIIVRISGGIGNQLFQYAFGKALSLRNNDPELRLDTHVYDLNIEVDRSLKLPHFNIPNVQSMIATPQDFKRIGMVNPMKRDIISRTRRYLKRKFELLKATEQRVMILEPGFDYYPDITRLKGSHYFSGVWQSEKYFTECTELIHSSFALCDPLSNVAEQVSINIQSVGQNSVSLHIRKGDIVRNPLLLKKYGDLGKDYYLRALDHILQKIPHPYLFIFSDDIEWCKENMIFDHPSTYVSTPKIPDYEELILMSRCAHNIIARSSFSWWAAWLNENPAKIIVAPIQRFGDSSTKAADLIPDSWIKL